jgi:hypothetical protein
MRRGEEEKREEGKEGRWALSNPHIPDWKVATEILMKITVRGEYGIAAQLQTPPKPTLTFPTEVRNSLGGGRH